MSKEIRTVVIRSRFIPVKVQGLECDPAEGMTQQHFKDECDINYLLKHYNDIPKPEPVYGDCTKFNNLMFAIDIVDSANAAFMAVPSDIRARFGNNPVDFFNFCNNPANKDELINLGLAEPGTGSLDVTVPGDTKSAPIDDKIIKEGE